jgi:predicted O-methyltransferase YrrM
VKTFSEWKPLFDAIQDRGLMASKAQAEFLFNLGRITKIGIEVGTFKGYSLAIVAAGMTSVESDVPRRLYSIDTFRCSHMTLPMEDTLPSAKGSLQLVGGLDLVEWIVADNREGWKRLPVGLAADWVFIDADHAYEPTLQNVRDYSKFVKPGGLIMFHDNDIKHFPEVVRAINSSLEEGLIIPLTHWDDFRVCLRQISS